MHSCTIKFFPEMLTVFQCSLSLFGTDFDGRSDGKKTKRNRGRRHVVSMSGLDSSPQ